MPHEAHLQAPQERGIGDFGGGSLEHPGQWLARAPEAVAGRPEGRPLPWERQASQSCQVSPEEAREPTSGTAKGSTLSMLCYVHCTLVPGSTMLKMSGSTW